MVSRPSWVICSPVGRDQVASSQGTFPPGSHRIETDCPKKRSAVIRKRLVRKGGEKTLALERAQELRENPVTRFIIIITIYTIDAN